MPLLELNLKMLFQDFNASRFAVFGCMLVFSLLFALRLDSTIGWSYWVVFLPIWIWKLFVVCGAIIGSWIWCCNPQYRVEGGSYIQYKSMIISTALQLLLLMFEVLVCLKLEFKQSSLRWILVFIPLIVMSLVSVAICIWAVKHERTFELELFCSVNTLQFIFLALKLDTTITWSWVIVFIPLWIVMCVALVGVLYAIILAVILLKSPNIVPEQRRGNILSAVGYTCAVIPLLVFQILLANKEDKDRQELYLVVCIPLFISLFSLMCMSFGAKGGNHWWFGIRRDFCQWLLAICPLLQEYGNISYKIQETSQTTQVEAAQQQQQQHPRQQNVTDDQPFQPGLQSRTLRNTKPNFKDEFGRTSVPVILIDMPD